MSDDQQNFTKWFKNPIKELQKNVNAGFIVVTVSLPLLERYLRQKTGIFEAGNLDDRFCNEFLNLFPSPGDIKTVRAFWEIYRHGLLHQAALKTKTGIIEAGLHNAAQDLEIAYNQKGWVFTVSPVKFSDKVIETIDNDFPTFEGHTQAARRVKSPGGRFFSF